MKKDMFMINVSRFLSKFFEHRSRKWFNFFLDWKYGWIHYQYGDQGETAW